MKKLLYILFSCALLLFACYSFLSTEALPASRQGSAKADAQQSKIDSLLTVLKTAKEDTNKVNILNDLSSKYSKQEPDIALRFGSRALWIAENLDFKKGIAISLNNIGVAYSRQHNYIEAIKHFQKALTKYEELKELQDESLKKTGKKGIAKTLNSIGMAYHVQGIYDKAINFYLKSLKLKEELKDTEGKAALLNNIGAVYYYQDNFEKTLYYYRQSLKIKEELLAQAEQSGNPDDIRWYKQGIARNIGNIGELFRVQNNYEKAIIYGMRSLKILKELENKKQMPIILNNLGNVYYNKGDYKTALDYYYQSLEIKEKSGNKRGIAISLNNIGAVYKEQGNYGMAIKYIQKSLTIAKEIKSKDDIKQAYGTLSTTYALASQYQKAYEFHQLYSDIKDILFNEVSSRQIAEMSEKYESEKKEKQIEIQKLELNRNRILQYALGGGVVMLLLLSFVVYNRYRLKRKANELLAAQKQVIETKNKDITDSIHYAENIQKAILPPIEKIKKALPNSFVLFKPKDIVSGDFYFFSEVNQYTIIAAVDCTGHGVPGAFMSMIGSRLLDEIVNDRSVTNAAEVLNQLRDGIMHAFGEAGTTGEQKDGMDIALCAFKRDKDNRIVTLFYAGAYNPLYLIREGELQQVKADKQPVGYHFGKQTPFTNHEIQLQKDDTIYLFSDGYQDQFGGPKGKKFMSKRFRQLFLDIQEMSMEEQKEHLDKSIEDWKEGREQVDDILIIGVRI